MSYCNTEAGVVYGLQVKQMENWQACAAVLWMFFPSGLHASHVTENYEIKSSTLYGNTISFLKRKQSYR